MIYGGLYFLALSIWECGYIHYYYGNAGLVPFLFVAAWVMFLGGIAKETGYGKFYNVLYYSIAACGLYVLTQDSKAVLIMVEYMLFVFHGAILTVLLDTEEIEEDE
jgi:hypothetical protein